MKKLLLLFILIFLIFASVSFAQDGIVTVISIKANIRGTPDSQGVIITTVNKGESYGLYTRKGAWYLIQTEKYVGWIHGNNIEELKQVEPTPTYSSRTIPVYTTPQKTTKSVTSEESLFENEYVGGGGNPSISITNGTDRTVRLTFGEVKYVIESGKNLTLTVDPGNYEYYATADRVRPLSGVEKYEAGRTYTWRFYIGTR